VPFKLILKDSKFFGCSAIRTSLWESSSHDASSRSSAGCSAIGGTILSMTEDELRKSLEQDLGLLRQRGSGGFSNADNMRVHLESVLLLERSNRNLASSSERLAKRNLWLTVAVFLVAVLQLLV
jgi:hypothetical protein